MIADEIRLAPDGTVKLANEADPNAPRVTPQNASWWRLWSSYEQRNGQVTIGLDVFLDMLEQIEATKP